MMSCGRSDPGSGDISGEQAAVAAGAPACVSDPSSWSNRGTELRAFKKTMNAKHPADNSPGGVPENAGDWAYASLPVDISSDGVFNFYFGPLASSFDWPNNPSGIAFDYDPPGFDGTIQPDSDGHITSVAMSGARYLVVPFSVHGLKTPCSSLTLWAY
jgi:hypothetical protein